MQIEARGYTDPIEPYLFRDSVVGVIDQSTDIHEEFRLLAEGNETLATSSDAALLQQDLIKLTHQLYFVRWAEDWALASKVLDRFPVLLDSSVFRQVVEFADANVPGDRDRLLYMLRSSFEVNPIEDGMDHPAEKIIVDAIRFHEEEKVFDWLKSFSLDVTNPNNAASVLRCLGRLKNPGTVSWRVDLMQNALAMEDAEIRDAAIQAAEGWGGEEIREVLTGHCEPLPWLRSYVQDVIEDLGD